MNNSSLADAGKLRVAVAAPLAAADAQLIIEREPRVELLYEPELVHTMRFPADYSGDPGYARTPEQQVRFDAMLDSADALYGIPDVDPAALRRTVRANPRLRWVQTMAAGGGSQIRLAELDQAELDRVAFTTSAGVHGAALAEFALFGLLAGAKHLPRLQKQQKVREWSHRWPMGQLSDQTVLVLGLGGIGRQVAQALSALGTTVIGVNRSGGPVDGVDEIISQATLPEVMRRVDAVVNTLPGTDATEKLLNADILDRIKPGATVVNVGRGTIIDEDALVAALDTGRVGFAALDVFAVEPLPDTSPLWTHPRVLVSPHTAALTTTEETRIAELFAENATRLLDGREMVNRVDIVEFY